MLNLGALQIVDSAFPTGGFAHSGGVEAAAQSGEVNGDSFRELLRSSLHQQAHGLVPFLLGAHRALDGFDDKGNGFVDICDRCDVFLSNHVARAASSRQGQALLASAATIFSDQRLRELRDRVRDRASGRDRLQPGGAGLCHLAPVFGVVTACLGVAAGEAARLYLFVALRDLVSSAIRLGIVGPLAGHAALYSLTAELERTAADVAEQAPAEAFQTAPLIDIVQMTHHRLYSRLFQS